MNPYYDDGQVRLYLGDVRAVLADLPAESVQCVVTSPPYWSLRDYGVEPTAWDDGDVSALGLEPTPELFVAHMVEVFREVRRVLRPDGTLWLNIGDSYAANWSSKRVEGRGGFKENIRERTKYPPDGLKAKDLVGIPWALAFALRADGWWLRQDIIWAKPNPMPESVRDRCTKAHEYLLLLSKSERYYWDGAAIREPHMEPERGHGEAERNNWSVMGQRGSEETVREYNPLGRNKRSVWTIPTAPFPEAHFATFPPALVEPCVLAGSREGDTVLDPFVGSGTTAMVARQLGRRAVGIDLNAEYLAMAVRRVSEVSLPMPIALPRPETPNWTQDALDLGGEA